MVDSIGSRKSNPVTHKLPVPVKNMEKSKRDKEQSSGENQEKQPDKQQDKGRIGGNIDERC